MNKVTLKTEAGDFRLRNLEFLIFEVHMSEILIGRPVLRATKFELDSHFASVRSNYHDMDFHTLFSEQKKPEPLKLLLDRF